MATTTVMDIINNRLFLNSFAAFNIILTAASGGAAIGMYVFSIPIIEDARPFSSKIMLRQFHHLIQNGQKYLQSASRLGTVTLAALTWFAYRHPDEGVRAAWVWFAAASAIRLQAAWYEVVAIFPVNDELVAMGRRLEKGEDEDEGKDEKMRGEVIGKLELWRWRHIGRIVIPFVAVGVMFGGVSI